MANFPRIVRSFQTPNIAPPRRISNSQGTAQAGGPQWITLAGTPSAADELAITFASTALAGSPITITITLGGGDTLATAAAALAAAITANTVLTAAGIIAAVVPSRPTELTLSQPPSLDPQATFTGLATGTTTMSILAGNITITAGRRGSVKTLNGGFEDTKNFYVKKWPKETTLADVLTGNVPVIP